MALSRKNLLTENVTLQQQRNGTVFAGCIESENFQGKVE
jgi:hypothetical protein